MTLSGVTDRLIETAGVRSLGTSTGASPKWDSAVLTLWMSKGMSDGATVLRRKYAATITAVCSIIGCPPASIREG
jgi:hypothetical protein